MVEHWGYVLEQRVRGGWDHGPSLRSCAGRVPTYQRDYSGGSLPSCPTSMFLLKQN